MNTHPKIDRPSPKIVCFDDERKLNYLLKESWKFPWNPVYFILKHFFSYTCMFPFFSNIVVWHLYLFISIRLPNVFHPGEAFLFFSFYLICFMLTLLCFCGHSKSVQAIREMRIGIVGMVACCWCLVVAILIKDTCWKVSFTLVHITMCIFPSFEMMFSSCNTLYFVHLPQYHPKFKKYSIGMVLIHIILALHFSWENYQFELLVLLIASCFFSTDLLRVFLTDSYMICLHYHYEWQSTPEQELRYNVIITSKGYFWQSDEEVQWSAV